MNEELNNSTPTTEPVNPQAVPVAETSNDVQETVSETPTIPETPNIEAQPAFNYQAPQVEVPQQPTVNTQPPQPNPYQQPVQGYQAPQPNPYQQPAQGYQAPQPNPYQQQPQSYTTGYYQYTPVNPSVVNAQNETDGFAVASGILSIIGLLTCCTFIPSLLGLIFGIISKTKNDGTRPTGWSTAGIIMSAIGLILSVLWWLLVLASEGV